MGDDRPGALSRHSELTNGSVRIRPYRPEDTARLFESARESIAEIYPWMEWCYPDYSMTDSSVWVMGREAAWSAGTDYSFVICDATTDAFIGGAGLNQLNGLHRIANLGYWVRTSRTRCGAATAATRLVARFGLETLHLSRIEIVASVHNNASQRVAEKAGATREGVLRNRLLLHGTPHAAVVFSIIPGDLGRLVD
jgi:ribosomal-protein-serine acetyltransferase